MRAWVAVIALLSVLALGAGCGRDAERDHGHAAHAHAVLAAKLVAKHRPAAARLDVVIPERVVVAPVSRSFTRVAPRAPVSVALAQLVSGPGARAPPSA